MDRIAQARAHVAASRQYDIPGPFHLAALALRGARYIGVAADRHRSFYVAYAEVGEGHILEAMGKDAADAIARLATLAARP